MKQRGRPSSSLQLIPADISVLDRVARIEPPRELTGDECDVWSAVVDSEPADWFTPATAPLLAQYCRHIVDARRLAERKEKALLSPDTTIEYMDMILRMQARESSTILALATKMRLTQQSTINQRGNKTKSTIRQPWDAK